MPKQKASHHHISSSIFNAKERTRKDNKHVPMVEHDVTVHKSTIYALSLAASTIIIKTEVVIVL
jgi:hypothetical protein